MAPTESTALPKTIRGWRMASPGKLEEFERTATPPEPGQALVTVAGCGICHTDLGYLFGGVRTKHALPLVLGHEISGVVAAAGPGAESWIGRRVLVPAVSPCGTCRACRAQRGTACARATMPGNDHDGGFASHVEVPAASLCPVDATGSSAAAEAPIGLARLSLWEISVVADAVTTPLQAIRRCGLAPGDLAVVIGVGGVGTYGVQLARSAGAEVAAVDVDSSKLERARDLGAGLTLLAAKDADLRGQLRAFASARGLAPDGWRIFEMSGTRAGQELAWSLLSRGGSVSVVGYTPDPGTFRLSNLMAFDATAYGNWGCDPSLYPDALSLTASGEIRVRGLVRREALADAPAILEAVHQGKFTERVVLVP